MNARTLIAAVAGAAALIAGCGSDDGSGTPKKPETSPPAATTSGAPKPAEPLAAAARRLQRDLPTGNCKALAREMMHSVQRRRGPSSPPTPQECAFVQQQANKSLRGFKVRASKEFGPAGITEGSGDNASAGDTVDVLWALDRDRSWKAISNAVYQPQLGFPPRKGGYDRNARAFITAVQTRDCNSFWRLANVASRFVRNSNGNKAAFCKGLPPSYKNKQNGIADLGADHAAKPKRLGAVRDSVFYGVRLKSGRYLVLVMSGRLSGVADAEQKDHADPSALELVTVRRPGD